MYKRWQEENLIRALATRRGVHLTGARQSGKSTLADMLELSNSRRCTFDNLKLRSAAESDPEEFVRRSHGETLVIDEIQKVPSLLEYIKIRLDKDNSKGQYLLTGSANLRFAKRIKDSLAGRLRTIRLRPLTFGELRGGKGDFLVRAFEREFETPFKLTKREVIHEAVLGGYPEALEMDERDRRAWCADYVSDILIKDIQDVTEIRKLESMRKVFDWLLAYSTKFFEKKDLCTQSQLTKETVDTYLGALSALYLFDGVEPWSDSDYDRIGKRKKYVAADAGLMANLLGWNEDAAYYDDDMCGKLVETWVYHQLASMCDLDSSFEIKQYRDSDKREIDFVVKRGTELLGVEVKAGTVGIGDFKHLKWFKNNLTTGRFTGVVLYSGSDVLSFGDDCFAVPFGCLGV